MPDMAVEVNSCGSGASDCSAAPTWFVCMTDPNGHTGIVLRKCEECMQRMLRTPAVQMLGRTVHLQMI